MLNPSARSNRLQFRANRVNGIRPHAERLEARILLYSALGDQWTYSSRITYSFMPDGTSVGGSPSVLFQTLNANYPTATWKQQIEAAASLWEGATNANLALVSDNGAAVGCSGNQQDDPRFGDIRIGAIPLSSGTLAVTFVPPPANGGTDAGDILLNSNVNWQINSNYDLMTVVAHEFGHALGLGESTVSTAVMYGTYNGIKQSLVSDDIAGIQSIYGTRQFDQFNTGGLRNNTYTTATNINAYINNAQIAIPGLDITTGGDTEWFYANVPTSSTGTMNVSVQSSNLSSLSPKLQVFNSSLGSMGVVSAPGSMGATISVSLSVQPGQGYYFKVLAAGGPGAIGGYGLLVNFGSQSQPPIPPPNTVVKQQPDRGGGTVGTPTSEPPEYYSCTIGTLTGWVVDLQAESTQDAINNSVLSTQSGGVTTSVAAMLLSNSGPATLAHQYEAIDLLLSSMAGALTPTAGEPTMLVLQSLEDAISELLIGQNSLRMT